MAGFVATITPANRFQSSNRLAKPVTVFLACLKDYLDVTYSPLTILTAYLLGRGGQQGTDSLFNLDFVCEDRRLVCLRCLYALDVYACGLSLNLSVLVVLDRAAAGGSGGCRCSSDTEAPDDLPYTLGLYTNRAVRTATVIWSEKELPETPSTTLGEDTDLASAELRPCSQKKRHHN